MTEKFQFCHKVRFTPFSLIGLIFLQACGTSFSGSGDVRFSPLQNSPEHLALRASQPLQFASMTERRPQGSLWSRERQSLWGDRRALRSGDILTVVVEIDDRAEISNSSSRDRKAAESLGIPQFFGLPQAQASKFTTGAGLENAIEIASNSANSGRGSVQRREKLTLRIAVTVVEVLENGVLSIAGNQEVRVNNEIRALGVSGFVRPEDISRQNQITYDKIALARVSYGGKGQVSQIQKPRFGYDLINKLSPF